MYLKSNTTTPLKCKKIPNMIYHDPKEEQKSSTVKQYVTHPKDIKTQIE